ncbi:hypothetical protein AOQ84DRAFT_374132 [Glonium stellatum]|uniref:CorA-like transporter domain-containing protein n=1 Tax=Glonium stellatum TaxID=574774 RepID=A0A8E2F672_9PEZI|nr:hypothetical protein AOQ84DRAFT_374132 [Glonium stellatum]
MSSNGAGLSQLCVCSESPNPSKPSSTLAILPGMSTYNVQNVLGSKESGYIEKHDLEMFLEKRFPRDKFPGPAVDRFHIREGIEQFEFWAPELVPLNDFSIKGEPQEWWDYPKCLEDYNPVIIDGDAAIKRIKELASNLFTDEDSLDVQIIERYEGPKRTSALTFFNEDSLMFFIKADSPPIITPSCRIISIPQAFSLSKLSINQNCMQQLLVHFNVSLDFLNVLLKFRNQPHIFKESSGHTSVSLEPDRSYSVTYQLMYVEKNGRKSPKDPWSMRQTGVFHRYSLNNNTNLFIFLHPMKNSAAQCRLEAFFEKGDYAGPLSEEAMEVHLLLFSSYLNNWQVYIKELGRIFKSLREKILMFDVSRDVNYNLSPDTLKKLRSLEDKVSFRTTACLQGAIRTVRALKDTYDVRPMDGFKRDSDSKKMYSSLSAILNRLKGHLASVEIMQKRIGATIGLIGSHRISELIFI